MSVFAAGVEEKYRRLGFKSTPLGMELRIGNVELSAAEHPWKGVVIIFTCITPRAMSQFDVAVPTRCSVEQIAGLIYVNITTNCHHDAETCRRHFEALNVPLFQ